MGEAGFVAPAKPPGATAPDSVCERCVRTVPMSIRACRTWTNTGRRCPPRGTLRLSWPLTAQFPALQGALRPTNDQGRTSQNVPICVAYTASHDVGKAAQNGGSRSR